MLRFTVSLLLQVVLCHSGFEAPLRLSSTGVVTWPVGLAHALLITVGGCIMVCTCGQCCLPAGTRSFCLRGSVLTVECSLLDELSALL
ncbi:hypothetical protein ACOMHN_011838 [Nucella lapillus]